VVDKKDLPQFAIKRAEESIAFAQALLTNKKTTRRMCRGNPTTRSDSLYTVVSLAEMTSPIETSVNMNLLSGSLPIELERMKNMTSMDAYENSLIGLLPRELSLMTNLQN
jgi:hypothetical protein